MRSLIVCLAAFCLCGALTGCHHCGKWHGVCDCDCGCGWCCPYCCYGGYDYGCIDCGCCDCGPGQGTPYSPMMGHDGPPIIHSAPTPEPIKVMPIENGKKVGSTRPGLISGSAF